MANDHEIVPTIVDWAKSKEDIRGVALVGSHARDQARWDSDIDLVFLTEHADDFRSAAWLATIDWSRAGVHPTRWVDEEYGVVWCRRIWLKPDFELELGFAPLSWAEVSSVDEGTKRVVSDGCRVLYDPDGLLKRLTLAVGRP